MKDKKFSYPEHVFGLNFHNIYRIFPNNSLKRKNLL